MIPVYPKTLVKALKRSCLKLFPGFHGQLSKVPSIVRAVTDESLTYLDDTALLDLYESVSSIEAIGVEGVLIEAGCALGGSAIVIASAKARPRPFFVYDIFGMIPPPSERDGPEVHNRYEVIRSGRSAGIGGRLYYGYEPDLLSKVRSTFQRHHLSLDQNNIHLIQGLYENTIYVKSPVALAHIDCDWYDSVMTCLTRIAPHLAIGGTLVIDDYDDWSGCRRAVDEYFDDKRHLYTFERKARLHVVRREPRCDVPG